MGGVEKRSVRLIIETKVWPESLNEESDKLNIFVKLFS